MTFLNDKLRTSKLASIFLMQDTVSVHRPGFYAHRFLDFCADRVFKKIPSREYFKEFHILLIF